MGDVQQPRLVVGLDTNSMHYLELFMRASDEAGLGPQEIADDARFAVLQTTESGYNESLGKGRKIVSYFLREDAQVELSDVAKIELLSGRLRGAAILSAANEGIPDRMWSRIGEDFIRDRTEGALTNIKGKVGNLGASLESWGIIVATGGERRRAADVLELAVAIVGTVYMSATDGIVYASAIAANADVLVTDDRYLRKTINLIRNPSGKIRFQSIKNELERLSNGELPQAKDCASL